MSLPSIQMASWGTPEPTNYVDYNSQSPLCENEDIGLATFNNVFLYSLVLLFDLVGNSLVLCFLVKYKGLDLLTKLFLLNLCLSDLVCTCPLLMWVSTDHGSWALCKVLRMTFCVGLYNNIFFLTIITVWHYLSVAKPQCMSRVHTLRCRMLVVAAMWVPSILSSIPDTTFHEIIDDQCAYSGTQGLLVSVYVLNSIFLLSMVTIFFCYGQILRTLFHSRSMWQHRLILTIVVSYVLSWAPYNLILFLQTLVNVGVIQSCTIRQQLVVALFFFERLAFAQCYIRPAFYGLLVVEFRTYLKSLQCLCSCVNCRRPALPCCPSQREPLPMTVPPAEDRDSTCAGGQGTQRGTGGCEPQRTNAAEMAPLTEGVEEGRGT